MGRSETHDHGHVNNVKLWERKKEGKNKYVLLFKQTSCPFFFPGLINWFEKVGTTTKYKLYSNNKASLKTIYHIILLVDPCIAQFLSNSIQIGLIQSIQSILIHLVKFNLFRLLGPLGLVWSITVQFGPYQTIGSNLVHSVQFNIFRTSSVHFSPFLSIWPHLALRWFFFCLDAK